MIHPKAAAILKLLRELDEDDALFMYGFDLEEADDEATDLLATWLDAPTDEGALALVSALAEAWKADRRAYELVDDEAPLELAVSDWLALGAPVTADAVR